MSKLLSFAWIQHLKIVTILINVHKILVKIVIREKYNTMIY